MNGTQEAHAALASRDWETTSATWKHLSNEIHLPLIRLRSCDKIPNEGLGWQKIAHRPYHDIGFVHTDNAGVITGKQSGIIVLDVDDEDAFAKACLENDWSVPDTFTVQTGNGHHCYFKIPDDSYEYGSPVNKNEGYDIRGDGGQIVAPGSIHPTGKIYTITNDTEFAPAPQWLLDKARVDTVRTPAKASKTRKLSCSYIVNLKDIHVAKDIIDIIKSGAPVGQRSEATWIVVKSLIKVGLEDEQILEIFESYPIGDKYLEKGASREGWLIGQIDKARKLDTLAAGKQTTRLPHFEELPGKYQTLVNLAHEKLIDRLRGFGNSPSKSHQESLWQLLLLYAGISSGTVSGRIAFPLGTGMGKTTSVLCFLVAAYEIGLLAEIAPVLATTKVEQLCDFKRDLIEAGIPEDMISLIHSKRFDPTLDASNLPEAYASLPRSEDINRPILLVTHSKVSSKKDFGFYMYYQGVKRKLMIWDESLISTDVSVINLRKLERELRNVEVDFKFRYLHSDKHAPEVVSSLENVINHINRCFTLVEAQIKEQREGGEKEVIFFPTLPADTRRGMCKVLRAISRHSGSPLQEFMRVTEFDLVVHMKGLSDPSVIHYEVVVPDHLEDMLILDASAEIRSLMTIDETIRLPEDLQSTTVSYHGSNFSRIPHNPGRDSISEELLAGDNGLLPAVIEIIQHRPQEPFILFTFKYRDHDRVDCRRIIEQAMKNVGIDPDAMIKVKGINRRQYSWLTHGNETASNHYSFCSNVIFLGFLHLEREVLTGKILAQQRDTLANLRSETVSETQATEHAYMLHQGSCRSSMRIVRDDKATPANVWYTYRNDDLQQILNDTLPETMWTTHESIHLKPKTKLEIVKRAIEKVLGELRNTTKISTTKIKGLVEGVECCASTFTQALKSIADDVKIPWSMQGRSLVKKA